jgi:hypothetical protein
MKTSRRDFIKLSGLAGIGVAGAGLSGCASGTAEASENSPFRLTGTQKFNMAGYAAPKLDTVRVGVIGLGNRGSGAIRRLVRIEGVKITALADIDPAKVNRANEFVKGYDHAPAMYSGNEDEWKKLCERDDVDLVYICTPWHLHTPNSLYAMENDKHAATEIPAAQTMDECWQLVETSERTKKHCIMLENVCYDFFEMLTLNMARQGFFGDIIHGEGAYIHDLMDHNFSKTVYADMWRLEENSGRNGSLYPMHGLGPICQLMDINYGDRMDYLVSVSSNDFMMGKRAEELAVDDDFWHQYTGRNFRGNINTTTIRTGKGRTIMVQHDVSSPRPYTRLHLISGTKGIAQKYPSPARIATSHHGWVSEDELKSLEEKFTPEITRRVGEMARQVGGHGGMDTLMDWRLVDCLRNGLPLDMNVYDAASWSSIIPLSEYSVANRSRSVDVPDFTGGAWQTNLPAMDIMLNEGGTTKLI